MARSTKGRGPSDDGPRNFTPHEANALIERLDTRLEELRAIDSSSTRWNDPRVGVLQEKIRDTAGEISWARSFEGTAWRHFQFARQRFGLRGAPGEDVAFDGDMQTQFRENLPRVIAGLEGLVDLVGERTEQEVAARSTQRAQSSDTRRVFVVHGHNEAVKPDVARTVERLGLIPIILHEQADGGRTIIEKLEDHTDVAFAVVLMTGDDRGGPKDADPTTYKLRARQNVLLELGLFVGRLGGGRVRVLYESGVDVPSDFLGVLFIPLDSEGAWRFGLVHEMKSSGLEVDANRLAGTERRFPSRRPP